MFSARLFPPWVTAWRTKGCMILPITLPAGPNGNV
jgi:hypothetical protein